MVSGQAPDTGTVCTSKIASYKEAHQPELFLRKTLEWQNGQRDETTPLDDLCLRSAARMAPA